MFTDIISHEQKYQKKRKRLVVGGNQALKMEGAELINRTLVGGRTSPLGSSKKKSNIKDTLNGSGQN